MSESKGALVKVGASAITVREAELGQPGERLAAQLIDGIAYTGSALAGYAAYWTIGLASTTLGFLAGAAIPVAFMGYQWYLLSEKGQTVGKQAMGLKIVDAESGGNPGFVKTVIMRNWVTKALCALPGYPLLNAAPVFWNPRRCLHDYIAGTVVVKDGSAAAGGATANPADELEMILARMHEELVQTQTSLVEAKVALKKAQAKHEALRAEAAKHEADARAAVQRGQDELAKKLLQAQRLKNDEAAAQAKHCEQLAQAVAALEATFEAQKKKLAEAKAKKGTLGTRQALLTAGESFRKFDDEVGRMEEKVGDEEIRLEVQAAMAPPRPDADPVAALPELDPIEAELEQLRKEVEQKKLAP